MTILSVFWRSWKASERPSRTLDLTVWTRFNEFKSGFYHWTEETLLNKNDAFHRLVRVVCRTVKHIVIWQKWRFCLFSGDRDDRPSVRAVLWVSLCERALMNSSPVSNIEQRRHCLTRMTLSIDFQKIVLWKNDDFVCFLAIVKSERPSEPYSGSHCVNALEGIQVRFLPLDRGDIA